VKERFVTVFEERLPEFCREVGVLWLVFSMLDRLVASNLTLLWFVSNFSVSVAAYLFGIYIEARASR
jgi:hypothetical protein